MTHERRGEQHINFSWIVRLRWCAIAGQLIAIAFVQWHMGIALPLLPLGVIIACEGLSNVACVLWQARRPRIGAPHLVGVLALDILILTALLYFTGGPFNPFSFLYLVHIALGAVVLGSGWTWALFVLSITCLGSLFIRHVWLKLDLSTVELHFHHMRMHLEGMWVAVAVAGAFIIYFVGRINRALARRDADLEAARNASERQAKLASLATLATGAAHELSTPLSTIATAARELERLLRGRGDRDAIADAELIRDQVERCRRILEQMAADAGQSGASGAFQISLTELLDLAAEGLDPARLRVIAEETPMGELVTIPVRPLSQAIRGVLKNAYDATDRGTVEVRCRVAEDGLHLGIRDDGPGMSREVLARAGEPFFTTKEAGRGLGLGLFLTRSVLEHVGGRLQLDSAPGRGTHAELTIPIEVGRPT